jgi:hypothetical protein
MASLKRSVERLDKLLAKKRPRRWEPRGVLVVLDLTECSPDGPRSRCELLLGRPFTDARPDVWPQVEPEPGQLITIKAICCPFCLAAGGEELDPEGLGILKAAGLSPEDILRAFAARRRGDTPQILTKGDGP